MRQKQTHPRRGRAERARCLARTLPRIRAGRVRSNAHVALKRPRAAASDAELGRALELAGYVLCAVALGLIARGLW